MQDPAARSGARDTPEANEDPLDDLLAECLDQPHAEWADRLAALCADHPEHAPELRRRFARLVQIGIIDAPTPADVVPERFGPYRLIRRLGTGTMGVVWLAEDERLGRQVALKVLRREHVYFDGARRRFRREMEAAARLDHPALCSIYEAGEQDDVPFLAMRYVAGSNLAEWLDEQRHARAPGGEPAELAASRRDQACEWVATLARALHAAHEAGFVHRDVKPANVALDKERQPVLLDFGLAHALDAPQGAQLTATGAQLGTPAYMAPEQVRGQPVDRRTDVWALGVVLYECLTLRAPFEADSREGLYRQIATEPPSDPRRFNRTIGRDLAAVLGKAVEKEPDRRFATALELAEELRRIRCHEPIRTRAPGPLLRSWRWCQRNKAGATILATVSVALVATLWLLSAMTLAQRHLRALAWLGAARSVLGEDSELAFKYAREALRQAPADPEVIAGVQAIAFELRDQRVVRDVRSEAGAGRYLERVEFSPEGDWFVLTGTNQHPTVHRGQDGVLLENGTLDAPTGMQIAPLAWAKGGRLACGFVVPADGSEAVQGRGQVRIYEVAGGHVSAVGEPFVCPRPFSLAFGPAGEVVAAFHNKSATVWRPDGTRTAIRPDPGKPVVPKWAAAMLPDGRILAAGAIWSSDGEKKLADLRSHEDPVMWVRVLAERDRIVTGALNGEVRLWTLLGARIASPIERPSRDTTQGLSDVDVSPDGELMVLGYRDGLVQLHRTTDGGMVRTWRTPSLQRVTTRFSRDGRRILGGTWGGAVHVWDLEGVPLRTFTGHGNGVFGLALDPRSEPGHDRFVTVSWDGKARLWSDRQVPRVARLDGLHRPRLAVLSATGETVVATRDGRLLLCDREGRVQREEPLPTPDVLAGVRIAPDGQTALVASFLGAIWTWDLRDSAGPRWLEMEGKVPWTEPRNARLSQVHGLADGSFVVGRNVESSWAFQWKPPSLNDRTLPLEPTLSRPNLAFAVATSRDGLEVLVGNRSGELRLVGLDGKDIRSACGGAAARDALVSVALFADGRAAAGFASGRVEIRDLATGAVLRELAHHDGDVRALAVSPDQSLLASAGADGTVGVWDTASGALRLVLGDRRGACYDVEFVSDDRLVAAGDGGRVLWWWLEPRRVREAMESIEVGPLTESDRARLGDLARR